jgi:monoamine oxidase
VILALPFTKLRQVKGLDGLKLGAEKLKCIQELGYGVNAKIMNGTTSRVWRSPDSGLPAPSNGTFYSDLGFQNLWETSRVQPDEAGIITDYLGSKPGLGDAKSALDAFRADLPKMSQKMADSVDPNAVTSWFWSVYPFMLGSYASAKTGQYTTLLDVVAEPALHGRLQFAGEHTSTDFLGFIMAESKAVTVPLRRSPRYWHSRTDLATATSNARSSKRDIQVLAEYDQGIACQWR